MTQQTTSKSKAFFDDLPIHELLDIDVQSLSDDESRNLVKVLQERRNSPQKRRAINTKQARKLSGKTEAPDISDLL